MAPAPTGKTRGRPAGTKNKKGAAPAPEPSDPFASTDEERQRSDSEVEVEEIDAVTAAASASIRRGKKAAPADAVTRDDAYAEPEKAIPPELLTRLLHEFFAKDSTRLSKDANTAVGRYVDVFVREAIARTAVEKQGGFLEV